MKQIEDRYEDKVVITCYPTLREKLRLLTCKAFRIEVDYSNDVKGGLRNTHWTPLGTEKQ